MHLTKYVSVILVKSTLEKYKVHILRSAVEDQLDEVGCSVEFGAVGTEFESRWCRKMLSLKVRGQYSVVEFKT